MSALVNRYRHGQCDPSDGKISFSKAQSCEGKGTSELERNKGLKHEKKNLPLFITIAYPYVGRGIEIRMSHLGGY